MRKILLFAVAFMMSVAMMAIGKGDGTSKANAIDFDWANGHKPALSAGSWYRVSLSHMKAEANDPTLALYLTNLTDVKASVTVVVEASIDVPLVGTQSGSKTATYSIAGKDYALWSLQSINTSKGSFSLKQLMEYDLKEVYLQLTANKEIALSAKVYETEDIVDDACTKAIDFDWNGAAVPAGEQWYRLDLADVKTNGNELKFVVANNGAKEAHVSFDMSLDCPASAVIEKDWVIAAGAEQKEDFGRVFLDFLNEDYIFVKLTTDQPLTFSVEEEVIVVDPSKPNPYEDFTCATAAELIFDEEMQLTAGKHVYKVKRAELIAERDFDTEFHVTNQSGATANLAVEVAFACPVKSVVTQNLEIGAHESVMKLVKGDMLKAVNSEWVYVRFITDQDLTATVGMRNVSPCATAVPFDWTTGADLAAGESQWYVVDITSLKQNKQHLTLNFTNHSDIQALVNVEVALDCEGTKLPMILPIPAGMNFGQTIDYQLLKKAPLPRIYVSVSTNAHIELASSVKSAIASDLTPCLNAINPEHGVEYTQKANTTQWYKLSLDLLESTADYSSIYLASKGNSTAHVTIGVVTDCQYTTGTKVTIPVPAGISFGALAPNVLGKLLKELARFENTYNKVDSKDLYLEIETDQPLGFGLDVVNAATNPCLRSDLITFDWNKGASVEKGDMKWFDMDIDAVKAAGKHVKLTFTNPTDSLVWAATMVSVECPAKLTMPLLVPVPAGMSVDKWINYQLFAVADIHNIYIGVLTDGALELKAESVDATIVPPADCLAAKKIVSGKEYVQDPGTQWYQFPMSLIDEMGGAMKLSLKNLSNNHATLTAGVTVGCEYAASTLVKAVAPKGIEGSLYMPKSIISKVRGLIDPAITDFYVQLTTDEKIAFSLINQATGANACSGAVDFDWTAWENNGFALEANNAQWYKVDIREPLKKLQNGEDITIGLTNPNPMEVEVDLAVSPTCPILLSLEKSITVPSGTSAGVSVTYDQVVQLVEKLDKYNLAEYDYKAMLKKVNVYMLYQKLDQELTERGYDEYVPLDRIEPIVNRYGEAASLVNAKKFLDNYETYLSVEELKKHLAPYKEQVSLETVINLLNKYGGDKIPKLEAEELLSNPTLLPYIGTVQTITDKCKQYITKENLKDLVERVKARVPFEEIKQLGKRVANKLQQYLPEPYTFYVYVKATGELVINPEIPVAPECDGVVMADTIVACDSYEWRGVTYTESGVYRDSVSATTPEDAEFLNWKQTVKLSEFSEPWYKLDVSDIHANKSDFVLQLENDLNTTLTYTLELYDCYNEIILSGTKNVTSGGMSYTVPYADFAQYTDGLDCDVLYLRNVNYDCDKKYELNLTINKSVEVVYTVDTCGTYAWNGKTYTAPFAGSDTVVLKTATDCDSVEILNLTLTECPVECTPIAVDTTIVACDSVVWNGKTYTVSDDYVDSLQTVNGCDSIVTLHLTINNPVIVEYVKAACESYDWKGGIYTTSGVYYDTLQATNGCDSIEVLRLTINNAIYTEETVEACVSYDWNGQTYNASGNYTYTDVAANGCDSIATLHLTINQPVDTVIKDTICSGELYNGEPYFSDTIFVVTETTANGCDSVVTMELTVLSFVEVDTTICVGETFNGVQYNAVGYEEVIVQYNNVACDSAIYYLTIEDCPVPPTPDDPCKDAKDSVLNVTICEGESYKWSQDDQTYTGEAHVTVKGKDDNGCDIYYTLNLTVAGETHTVTACDSYTYEVDGQTYTRTTSGVYTHPLAGGCEYVLNLTINNSEVIDQIETSCGAYTWAVNGQTYDKTGTYQYVDKTTEGCALTYNLDLTVYDVEDTDINVVICEGEEYEWKGEKYSTEGIYTKKETINGCTATHTLNLTVAGETQTVTTCDSYTYEVEGQTYTRTTSGVYRHSLAGGCEYVLNLTINKSEKVTYTITVCDSYEWHGTVYTQSGAYTYTTDVNGCERVETLNLTINNSKVINDNVTTCEPYTWDVNGQIYDATGVYDYNGKTVDGCDLTATLNLTIVCPPTPQDPCADAELVQWDDVFVIPANVDKWYKVDYTTAVASGKDVEVTLVNGADYNNVEVKYYTECFDPSLVVTPSTPSTPSVSANPYGWQNKNDMFQALMADCGVTTLPSLDELKAMGANGLAKICTPFFNEQCQAFLDNPNWNWLEEYILSVSDSQGVTLLSVAYWRYAVAAFFLETQKTGWPKSADFSVAGQDAAYLPAWGYAYDSAPSITVKAKVPAAWTDQIYVWVWPTGGEGTEYPATKEGDWWTYTHTGSDVNILFKNGTGWTGLENQTENMSFTENACVEIEPSFWGDKAKYITVECENNAAGNASYHTFTTTFLPYETKKYTLTQADMANMGIVDYVYAHVTSTGEFIVTADTIVTPDTPCEDETIEYWVTQCDPYVWADGDGQAYDQTGDYPYVTTKADGCTLTKILHLTIDCPPTPPTPQEPCATAELVQWDDVFVVPANADKWYKVDFRTAVASGKDVEFTMVNGAENNNLVVKYSTECSGSNPYGWQNKNDMFQALMADCGVTGLASLDELKAQGTQALITICAKLIDVSSMLNADKWDWLEAYIMQVQHADPNASKLTAGMTSAGWRYAVAAFFLESQRTSWPKSADFSVAGQDAAYLPSWGYTYATQMVASGITIKAKVPANWTDQIYVWVWPTGGSGTEYIAQKDGDWWTYTYTGNDDVLNIIFKNGEGWTGRAAYQTIDMKFAESTCIELHSDSQNMADYTAVACGEEDTYNTFTASFKPYETQKHMLTQTDMAKLGIVDYVYAHVTTTGDITISGDTIDTTTPCVDDTTEYSITQCEPYEWYGETYDKSGDYTHTSPTADGCTLTEILHLTIDCPPTPPTPECEDRYHKFTATFCTSYTWNGVVYDKAGDYVQTFNLANGCDSIVTLHLVEDCVTPCVPVYTEFAATFCGEYNWNGTIYTAVGDYKQTLIDINGCDSIVTLHLTEDCPVTPECDDVETEFTTTFCGSFTWNGVVYTQAGDYVQTLSKTDGCDSIITLHLVEECPIVPELPENPCLNAIEFDWLKGAYLTAGDAQWYEMDITSLVENKQHVTLTFTNHSNTTAWVHAVVALDCEGIIVPMLLPVPAGLSVSQTIDYQLLVRSPLKRIYVGVYSETADIELQSSVKDAIADDQTPCLNATEVQYNVRYVNEPGTSWYKISTDLLKNQSDLTGFYFANKGNARAHATIGMVADCQYTTGTTITLPIPAGFEINVMAPNILGQLMQELEGFEEAFNNWDVKEIYMALTTDETVEFELSTRDINQACETATEIDWKEWETNGLQLKANQEEWYAFEVDYLLEKLMNDKEISIAVSNLDTVAVDVDMSFSPTCPVVVTLDRSFTVPAKTSAKKTISVDDLLQWLAQYEKYVPYEQVKLFVEKCENRFSVAELKDMLDSYEKYVSVAQLKQELAKHKEYISYETIAAALDKYGKYIPYDEAKTLLDKYEPYLTIYAGGVAVLLDKCEPYITMDNFKKVVVYCKQHMPYEELKQLFTIFENYITNYHCYLRVKTTGDLYAGPKPLPIPCEDVVEEMTVATCDAYEWKGITYNESGDYTYSRPLVSPDSAEFLDWTQPIKLSEFTAPWYKLDVSNVIASKTEFTLILENDYDSIQTITLALYDNPTDDYIVSVSNDVEPGVYPRTFTYDEFDNTIGTENNVLYLRNVKFACEHIEILHLTINKSIEKELDVEACDTYTWHGNTYTTSGDYTFNGTTTEGCDLTEILHLTIIPCEEDTVPTKTVTITDLVCDGTAFVDTITDEKHIISSLIPSTQTWTDMIETVDTIYTYNFIITPIVAPALLDDAALALIPGATPVLTQGLVPDVTGTTEAIKSYYEANDADSLADVTAVYWDAASLTVQVACGAVSHTMNLVVETACDNVLKTSHTFDVPALEAGREEMATICYGETYMWNSKIYSESGIYRDTIIGTTGCDSIAILNLTVLPKIVGFVEETVICYGETYTWLADGKTYDESGRYTVTLSDVNGCDSVVTLALTVLPEVADTEETVYVCAGESYEWNGTMYTEGDYTITLQDPNGCPYNATLHLKSYPKTDDTEETVTLCYGETYDWNGQTYDASGDYSVTLQDANGCDYTATLHLTVRDEITLPNVTADDITTICGKAIDVTAADAIIQAHIAAYDWVEQVVWEVLVNGKWEALTDTAIDGKAETVTVRYTIQTACEDVTNTLTVVVEMRNPENDESLANVPAYNKYGGRLLTVDLRYIEDEFGWNVAEEDVTWYLVVEGGTDVAQGTGYYLTTEDGTPLPAGSYYALIEYPATSEGGCDVLLQTEILVVETQVEPMLAPTVVKPQDVVKLMNLNPDAVSTVRMYSAAGELMDTFQVTDKKETSFHAAHAAGYYIVDVQTETEKVSLRYIVK